MTTREQYDAFLGRLRKETGVEAFSADESGLVCVRIDDAYNLNLQFVGTTGKILCFVEVFTLPHGAPASVYRDLLAGGLFGKDTAGGHFAVESHSETVVYQYFFDFDRAAADLDEFIATLEKILQLCDIWAERLRRDLSEHVPADHHQHDSLGHTSMMMRA